MNQFVQYPLHAFIQADDDKVLGQLTQAVAATGIQSTRTTQVDTWKAEIDLLKRCASYLIEHHEAARNWQLILEYELPRRQKRPDAVLLAEDVILLIEFKVGAKGHDAPSSWQVEDYCLNLRDFHEGSAGHMIVPILCATDAPAAGHTDHTHSTPVTHTHYANATDLASILLSAYRTHHNPNTPPIDTSTWAYARYRPTPSIIEAAERLYQNHDVREINHRYATNLGATTDMLVDIVQQARTHNQRTIRFITGIPGAGKTLTGLNVVHNPTLRSGGGPSGIFLSGNTPLVKVVQEALISSQQRAGRRKKDSTREVTTFIQNVHNFLRYHREHPDEKPHEHVVVFDEAQRAWDQHQMMRKRGVDRSEAAELFDVMNRLDGWAVIVALVGGGQEIYLGEAGLEEWGRAVAQNPTWRVVASPEVISGGTSVSGHRLFSDGVPPNIHFQPEPLAHLDVGVRSHRAQRLAEWVDAVLNVDIERARPLMPDPREFPLGYSDDRDR